MFFFAIIRSETLLTSDAHLLEFPDRVLEMVALVAAVAAVGGWEYLFGHSLVLLFFFCSQQVIKWFPVISRRAKGYARS